MIDYAVFEKKPEGERPAWTLDSVKEFCEEQKYDVVSYEDSPVFVVAKLTKETEDTERKYRHIELTETVSFIIRDDPSLDEFLQPVIPEIEIPKDHPMAFPQRHTLTIEEIGDSKEEETFSYF